MGAKRRWPRRKVTSLRRIIAKYRLGRVITREEIENRPEKIMDRLNRIAPPAFIVNMDAIVRTEH
jgi:hypothetical protein